MCFVFIWEQTATCATYIINWLVFITENKSVYCAVRTGSSNKAVCASSLIFCKRHPDEGIIEPKHVAVWILYKAVFHDYSLTFYFKENQFVCGHKILIDPLFVKELSLNAWISVRRTVWVTTHCRFNARYIYEIKNGKVKGNFHSTKSRSTR